MRRLSVAVEPPYDVVVGSGALEQLKVLIGGRRQVHVVSQRAVMDAHGEALTHAVRDAQVEVTEIDDGELAKSLEVVATLCRSFAASGLLRDDVVVAFGGGVVGDTAGFAAAVYHRGIDVVQVPTTLLAQVDAAIGGKTAVNLPEGKNLVGAFHQPIGVVADTSVLATLPDREYRSGLGEVAKYALMPEGREIAETMATHRAEVLARDGEVLTDLVAHCAAIKAAVVAADPHERTGVRARLNYGHTLAHALETVDTYSLSHGEAVAVGLVFAVHLAGALGRVGDDEIDRAVTLLAELELPVTVEGDLGADDLLAVMRRDKKASGGLTFVVPGANGLELVEDPSADAVATALRAVGVGTGASMRAKG